MAFHSQSLYRECSRYPYVGRVSVGEQDRVDFIYQFVKKRFINDEVINPESYTHGIINPSVLYTAGNITGIPTKFLNSTYIPNSTEIFREGTYEPDRKEISLSPWKYKPLSNTFITNYFLKNNDGEFNYIDVEFHEAVYPIRVSMYEIYNPGNVIKIWAQDCIDNHWFLLWDGSIQFVLSTSRLFSPPLNLFFCYYKTKKLKLQFRCNVNYYSILDAVMLIGTSELILPKNSEKTITEILREINCTYFHHEVVHNLTANFETAHLDIVILQENLSEYCKRYHNNVGKDFHESFRHEKVSGKEIIRVSEKLILQTSTQNLLFYKKYWSDKCSKYIDLSSDKSEKLSHCNLSVLSDEIILKIFKELDLTSLCRMSQVNKRFNNLTQDPHLYTRLNMRYVHCKRITFHAFRYFTSRCKYLTQLDLTSSEFAIKDFIKFLDKCGRRLTHLRFYKSSCVSDLALKKISEKCKNLKVLDLESCHNIYNKGFSYLANLNNLQSLDLSETIINTSVLCKILQSNSQIRELRLQYLINEYLDFHAVIKELKNSCKNVETIDLLAKRITSDVFEALADCKQLCKINFQCILFDDEFRSLCKLFSSCQHLEEIHLTDTVLTDDNLVSLTKCKNLKRLHICEMFIEFVTSNNCSIIFEQCSKLQEIYFWQCNISDYMINQWREKYPYICMYVVKKRYKISSRWSI